MTLHNAVGKPLFDFSSTTENGARRSLPQESETARTVIDRIRDYAPYRSAMTPLQYRIVCAPVSPTPLAAPSTGGAAWPTTIRV